MQGLNLRERLVNQIHYNIFHLEFHKERSLLNQAKFLQLKFTACERDFAPEFCKIKLEFLENLYTIKLLTSKLVYFSDYRGNYCI